MTHAPIEPPSPHDRPTPRHSLAPAGAATPEPAELWHPSRIATLLRALGVLVLVGAAFTFLVQHWAQGDDVQRYLLLLAQAVTLAAAGTYAGLGLREPKSARTFFGLVLAVTPVHFGVLAGLLYSRFSIDAPLASGPIPHAALWVAPSDGAALGIAALGLAVIVPLVVLGFSTLARGHVAALAAAFLLGNALLLVPTRDPSLVGWLFVLGVVGANLLQRRGRARLDIPTGLDTPAGRVVRVLPYAGSLLLLGRSLYLYDPSQLLLGLAALTLWVVGFVELGRGRNLVSLRELGQWLVTLAGALGWNAVVRAFQLETFMPDELWLATNALPVCLGVVLLAGHAVRYADGYRRLGVLTACGAMLLELCLRGAPAAAAIGLAVGAIGLLHAARLQQLVTALASLAVLLGSLGVMLAHLVRVPALDHWTLLSLFGVALIVAASAVEKRKERIVAYLTVTRGELAGWSL